METRQARSELTVYTRRLEKLTIPPDAILRDFRTGPGLLPLRWSGVLQHRTGDRRTDHSRQDPTGIGVRVRQLPGGTRHCS